MINIQLVIVEAKLNFLLQFKNQKRDLGYKFKLDDLFLFIFEI